MLPRNRSPQASPEAPPLLALPPAMSRPAAPAPLLKISGQGLGSPAALVRLVAAAAYSARKAGAAAAAPGYDSRGAEGSSGAKAGASWGGATLAARQTRALQHSRRLHACYLDLLAAGSRGAAAV